MSKQIFWSILELAGGMQHFLCTVFQETESGKVSSAGAVSLSPVVKWSAVVDFAQGSVGGGVPVGNSK